MAANFELCVDVPLFKTMAEYMLPVLLRSNCMMALFASSIFCLIPGVRVVVNMLIQIINDEANIGFIWCLLHWRWLSELQFWCRLATG